PGRIVHAVDGERVLPDLEIENVRPGDVTAIRTAVTAGRHQLAVGSRQLPGDRIVVGKRIEIVRTGLGDADSVGVGFAGNVDRRGNRRGVCRQQQARLERLNRQSAAETGGT